MLMCVMHFTYTSPVNSARTTFSTILSNRLKNNSNSGHSPQFSYQTSRSFSPSNRHLSKTRPVRGQEDNCDSSNLTEFVHVDRPGQKIFSALHRSFFSKCNALSEKFVAGCSSSKIAREG
jgi:hypothetical protein